MASPNHKAGLAVVVPASDNRSQPRGKVKQNAFTSPRKSSSQPNGMVFHRSSTEARNVPPYLDGFTSPCQPNGTILAREPSAFSPQQPSHGSTEQNTKGTGRPYVNGTAAQPPNGIVSHEPKGVVPARRRLLEVDEALQYSPFSSIVPFGSGVVPIPNANIPGSQQVFSTLPEQRTARQPLNYLDEDLIKTKGQSSVAQRARHDLNPFLDPAFITDFKFKPIKGLKGAQGRPGKKEAESGPGPTAPKVGPFANMMLQATNLADRYPTPISPEATSPTPKSRPQPRHPAISSQAQPPPSIPKPPQSIPIPKQKVQTLQQQSPFTPATQRFAHNDAAYSQNSRSSAKSEYVPTSTQAHPIPMVIIPPSSAEARRSDFITYDEPSPKDQSQARKRKRDSETQLGAHPSQTKDQRAASGETLRQLQEVIQNVFEAEDQSQPDESGRISVDTQYFVSAYHEDREILTMAPSVHIRLESLLHKVTTLGIFGDIPVEHLQRLQGLSVGALTSAESSELQLETDCNADGFARWVSRLDAVDAGLRSARSILRIMTGGREEKQLFSEEILQSLLGVVKKVLDSCIIPIVELRSSGSTSVIFEAASSSRKILAQLLFDATKVMALVAKLLAKVDVAEIIVTKIEFFATPLLFVENAHSEKESILGIQKFETLRRTAMDQIATIFSRYPEQRITLFDEILTSLQKLPVTEKHARQYRLTEGKSIMLVSALVMQLVQTSASRSTSAKGKASCRTLSLSNRDGDSGSESSEGKHGRSYHRDVEGSDESDKSEDNDPAQTNTAMEKLSKTATLLTDHATKSAQYFIKYIVQRAQTTAKTSESPHRQHLDMFVQDFIAVLGAPEWPAAELLLRMVFASCRNIAELPKSLAPAKNMALELLGMMGQAISELVSSTCQVAKTIENQDSEFCGYLRQMLDDYMEGSLESSELVMWDGPYHAIVEYLESNSQDDLQISSAQAYYLAQWAKAASSGGLKADAKSERLALNLEKMLLGVEWVISDTLPKLSSNESRIAYRLTVLSMGFCRQSDYILKILLDGATSEQITVRSRSLKSVDKMLEGDPSVLDRARNVKMLITNCATDASSMVRESALTLIGKCITLKPTLEQEFLRQILRLTEDPAAGIRKRSMRMLKDIYLRTSDNNVKTVIGESLLQRAKDLDNGVSDLARQIFEDIWLSPLWNVPDLTEASAQNKVYLRNQASLIVSTVRRSEKAAFVLGHLLKAVLSNNSKNAAGNFKACKSLVATAFDIMIDNFQDAERLEQRHILHTLTVFATANAKLFTSVQLQTLQPYIANLSSKDDLEMFRSIVIIFRCVLPLLSNVQHGLLREIQTALLQSIAKLGKAELNEVAECLWTINGTLQNPHMLLKLTISVLKNLHNMQGLTLPDSNQSDDIKRVKKYIQIAGYFGKHCDFEYHSQNFQSSLTWWKGRSVAGLIIDSISPFTASAQPLSLRAQAFDSVGLICQSWPYEFTQENISNGFQDVLRKGEPELQTIVLSNFRDFFARIDRQAEAKGAEILEGINAPSGEKLGGSMTANEGDGASALIAQRFLKDILNIAIASQDASALTATEVIASINRQGLVHPKESGPALVALETSTNPLIAEVARQEHRLLHQQHESMFEREYMRAIQETFRYQRDIVGDTLGYTTRPYASKLSSMFEIIKTSKAKYQKKFLSNFCSKIDCDISKMELSGTPPNALQFSRFLIENLAFFDYGRLDELLHTIACMEKIVADNGSGIAHSISTEIFNITVESMPEASITGASQGQDSAAASQPAIDFVRLHQLTTASIILASLWEARTYLRRLYGLSASLQRKDNKAKPAAKDLSKAPSRIQGMSGDKFVTSIADKVGSLSDEEQMIQQCKDFVELLSVDTEVKVAAGGEEGSERPETPSDDEERDTPMSGGSKGAKRKASVSLVGTPMKKKKGRPSLKRRKSGKSAGSDEDWD